MALPHRYRSVVGPVDTGTGMQDACRSGGSFANHRTTREAIFMASTRIMTGLWLGLLALSCLAIAGLGG